MRNSDSGWAQWVAIGRWSFIDQNSGWPLADKNSGQLGRLASGWPFTTKNKFYKIECTQEPRTFNASTFVSNVWTTLYSAKVNELYLSIVKVA